MTDIRKCAQAVIGTWDEYGVTACIVHIEALRQALAKPEPSIDALIAEAVAKERKACAQLCDPYTHGQWFANRIRARGQK